MKNLNLKNIGSLIKAKRKEMGYTQSELADKVGISAQHCSRIERGEYIPSLQTFLVIVDVIKYVFILVYSFYFFNKFRYF